MTIHNVEITKVSKNDIVHRKVKKHKKARLYSLLLILLIPVLAMGCLRLYSETTLRDIYTNVCNLYNPIYSPFAETSNIIFAWNYTFEESLQDFEMPIHSSEITLDDNGTITAKVKESILVKSVADGVVDSIEEVDGVKVVKILYADNIYVKYINLDVVGVVEGNVVGRGKEIGTAKLGSEVKFQAFVGDNQINNLKIINNKIVWQN